MSRTKTPERLRRLRLWATQAGQDFEWRRSSDAWLVFVSEMLLRRTRAEQVADALPLAMAEFPRPGALAEAPEALAANVFRTVGLHGRIEQLHRAAQEIVEVHGGEVPWKEEDLLRLTGVGPYVAAIVSSRLSGSEVVLVDTNSVRVAIRVLGIESTTKDPRREKQVVEAVEELLGGPAKANDWFHLIDLAHTICMPAKPNCEECPLSFDCAYFSSTRS